MFHIMPDDDTYKFRDYTEGTESKTPCPKCGTLIARVATVCHDCGQHFRGYAEDFNPAFENDCSRLRGHTKRIALILLAIVGVAMVIAIVMATMGIIRR